MKLTKQQLYVALKQAEQEGLLIRYQESKTNKNSLDKTEKLCDIIVIFSLFILCLILIFTFIMIFQSLV